MSGGKSNFESITSAPGLGPNSAARKKGWLPRLMFRVGFGLALIGAGVGLMNMHKNVQQMPAYADKPAHVRLANLPDWMPRDVAVAILQFLQKRADGRKLSDEKLSADVYHAACRIPWMSRVAKVVKYQDGTVMVFATYRRPFARVSSQQSPAELKVVDQAGFVLPIDPAKVVDLTPVRIGEIASPPPAPGLQWKAPDLADGLKLLGLIAAKPYVREIAWIDVRNFDGKMPIEPRLRMVAQNAQGGQTDIRFGRFDSEDGLDPAVSTQRKLEYLDAYFNKFGHLAGVNTSLDLRYRDYLIVYGN